MSRSKTTRAAKIMWETLAAIWLTSFCLSACTSRYGFDESQPSDPPISGNCSSDDECNDALFCNGEEYCDSTDVCAAGELACPDSTCTEGSSSALCGDCPVGFIWNDVSCEDIDECTEQSDDCDPAQGICTNTEGAWLCSCEEGFELDSDGATCIEWFPDLPWVAIAAGSFDQGSLVETDEQPIHSVSVPAFEILKTEVTVEHYALCVDHAACSVPDASTADDSFNWGDDGPKLDRLDHPINYVDWFQATAFCAWAGGRLPSESEWEYTARSEGQDIIYPWGDTPDPSCDYTVMLDGICDTGHTMPVCSKVAGNTAQALCDMAGNVWEWVEDWAHITYTDAPTDGSAWIEPAGSNRVIRGGSLDHSGADYFRTAVRTWDLPIFRKSHWGFRCAKSAP
ncbi:SUMF1/EgtB/PvdO family nonheme iron enzyme [Myxococcota bacterium]|nr:SUMF1/EgtB/PvdO family nonheme iron enzyme [Myxococcota bacterium]